MKGLLDDDDLMRTELAIPSNPISAQATLIRAIDKLQSRQMLSRLRAAARRAASYAPGVRVLAADTGPAALYGALPDDGDSAVLVNVGNGHTVCAVALAGRLAGVFEHHTGRLDGPGLDQRLRRFLSGDLTSDEVREDGGHGAVLAAATRKANLQELPLFATGPRRALLERSTLPLRFAAPHGDMMLTGCFGLLRAVEHALHRR